MEQMERCAWDALQEQARSEQAANLRESFSVKGAEDGSLLKATEQICRKAGLVPSGAAQAMSRENDLCRAVLYVYYDALHLGLIIPGMIGQDLNWNASNGAYQFTERGRRFLSSGEVSLSSPGLLPNRVREVVDSTAISPALIPLTSEAQRCWAMGCLRAAMVLIGLSVEDVCTELLGALRTYPSPPREGSAAFANWAQAVDESKSFYPRWQAGLQSLERVKTELRKTHGAQRPSWWATWEPVPGAIQPYGEAVRIGRNAAAHSVEDVFTAAQVGLLLAALPSMLRVVSDLMAFLANPPAGVSLPQF